MSEPRIGVYICHCGKNIAGVIDVSKLVEYASKLPGVVVAREYPYMCSSPGQELVAKDIRELGVNRVVIAACSPKMHEQTFQKVLEKAGVNPHLLEFANIREHVTWVHSSEPEKALEKAKALVAGAVAKAALLEPIEPERVSVKGAALVVGGGIAGIRAALDIANAGFKVYLVEKQPSIGGHMAKLDKTFPTLDCSQCILTPLMVEAASHPNIELMTYSEVESVEGYVGNFKVKVRRKAAYVDWDKCVGCGLCAEKCPVKKVPDEFNEGLGYRTAIYFQFPQAVPRRPVIDSEHCLYFTKGVCRVCEKVCPAGAIDFSQEDRIEEIEVGAIVVATGFKLLDPREVPEYGYGRFRNVITGLELERLSSAGGPTAGKILRPSDGKPPKRVAILLCVGSRDEKHLPYCCRVGCMNGLKHTYYVHSSSPDTEVVLCFMDMRAFGKGFEEFYRKVRSLGNVVVIRGKPGEIRENPDGTLTFDVWDTGTARPYRVTVDLVVLENGVVPSDGTAEIREKLKLPAGPDGFLLELHPKLRPVETAVSGVFLAGFAQGPKDIPDTVAQASAAAAQAVALMSAGVVELPPHIVAVNTELCGGCGVCVGVCSYNAIKLVEKEGKTVAEVTPALCRGCGACAAACPSGAMQQHGFTDEQLHRQVEAVAEVRA